MNDLYLIAHLVRGKPAFDVARRCEDMGTLTDPGPWWIIPTSGHRAWPYWSLSLPIYELEKHDSQFMYQDLGEDEHQIRYVPFQPDSWPDHYPAHRPAITERDRSAGAALLAELGL